MHDQIKRIAVGAAPSTKDGKAGDVYLVSDSEDESLEDERCGLAWVGVGAHRPLCMHAHLGMHAMHTRQGPRA